MTGAAAPVIPPDWLTWISRMPAEGGPSGADWARGAQRLLGEAFERWGLVADGPLRTGWTAVVVPVLREGERCAVKVVRRSVDTVDSDAYFMDMASRVAQELSSARARGELAARGPETK